MKPIFAAAATAIALTLSAPALADGHTMGAEVTDMKGDFYAQDFIGKELYVPKTEWDENFIYADGWETEWDNVGEVENLILNQNGSVRAVIVDIGGFLNIGEKRVAMPMERVKFYYDQDSWDNYFIGVNGTQAQLEALPEYEMLTPESRGAVYAD